MNKVSSNLSYEYCNKTAVNYLMLYEKIVMLTVLYGKSTFPLFASVLIIRKLIPSMGRR